MAKVVRMFGRSAQGRESEERRSRVRSTAYVSGQDTRGAREETPKSAVGAEVADDRARALACLVLDHREGLGLSQSEFAQEAGISRATLSKIEQGRLYPGAWSGASSPRLWASPRWTYGESARITPRTNHTTTRRARPTKTSIQTIEEIEKLRRESPGSREHRGFRARWQGHLRVLTRKRQDRQLGDARWREF